jgi:hypothetical protein
MHWIFTASALMAIILMSAHAATIIKPQAQMSKNRHRLRSDKEARFLPSAVMKRIETAFGAMGVLTEKATKKPGTLRTCVWSKEIDVQQLTETPNRVVHYTRLVLDPRSTFLRPRPANSKLKSKGWGINLPGDILKITSLQDGGIQYLNNQTLKEWSFNTAFFNGGRIRIELLVHSQDEALQPPQTPKPSVMVSSIVTHDESSRSITNIPIPPPNTLCEAQDRRELSNDLRVGRIFPVGCTGWTIADKNGCQLTAGHCFDRKNLTDQVFQLRVPLSKLLSSSFEVQGIPRHPHPGFQFALDASSVKFNLSRGADQEDWGYFGTFRNPNTGLTARETAKGAAFKLAPLVPTTIENSEEAHWMMDSSQLNLNPGVDLRVTGYGVVYDPDKQDRSQVLQTHVGSFVQIKSIDPYHLDHRVDSTGGNSGSAIIHEGTGMAIGIHTNGGCFEGEDDSSNWGSTVAMRGLQAALASPSGVCAP